jgi:hypothetical protein
MDFDVAKRRIVPLQVVTDKANYSRGIFGVALRSVP